MQQFNEVASGGKVVASTSFYRMIKATLIFALSLHILQSATHETDGETRLGNPTVIISQGEVEGKDIRYGLRNLDRFLAIPYAKPPIDDLRYKPPEADPGWQGTYDASGNLDSTLKNKACLQPKENGIFDGVRGSEDCLYINVWVPGGVDQARKNPLPVMVWIYGEAYSYGSSWGPEVKNERVFDLAPFSSEGNVVAVSFNYRLGPLGFLSTADENSPGNYGMLDQVMALQWVQDNIWAFGGRSNQITLFGESTGATSVSLHMLSPLSGDLFQRAISQSGTALSQWALIRDPLSNAIELAENLNCTTNNTVDLMNCVKSKPADEVVLAVQVYGVRKQENLDLPWGPVVDGFFLPANPETLIGNSAGKSYLLGSNSMDGHLFAELDFPLLRVPFVPFTELSLLRAIRILNPSMTLDFARIIEFEYQRYSGIVREDYYKDALTDLYTDYMFTAPTHIMVSQHSAIAKNKSTEASTYVYVFTEPRSRSLIEMELKLNGAEHGQELQYVFDIPDRAPLQYTRDEQDLAKTMIHYWANFAWTGDPNQGDAAVPAQWPEYDGSKKQYMDLNAAISMLGDGAVGECYRGEYLAFWGRMIPQVWGSDNAVCETISSASRRRTQDNAEMKEEADFEDEYYEARISNYTEIQCDTDEDFVRQTEYGCIRGEIKKWNGRLYSQYLGIPYAAPPVSENRFEKPVDPTPWDGVKNTISYSKICPQSTYDEETMSEDCLYLNLYVPIDSTLPYDTVVPGKYAVMVWLHGGSYMSGDGAQSYVGDVLAASQQVIIVTLNYRLGALGFLSTGNRFSPGNYGLWDQNFAMQWVRDNIAGFGGDPERITIFGQGAGAECAQLHTISPSSRNLGINQTILQSGTAYAFNQYPDQEETTDTLAKRLGCAGPTTTTSQEVECLRVAPVADVIAAQGGNQVQEPLQFAPVVDGSFLLRNPESSMSVLQLRNWIYMIGVNSGDGTPYWNHVENTQTYEDFRHDIKQSFSTEYGVATDDIQFQYTDWSDPYFDSDLLKMQQYLFNLYTDERYVAPANQVALKATAGLTDVYFYYLNYPYDTEEQEQYPSWAGVAHGGDIPYVWGDVVRDSASEGANPDASLLSYNMMNYWANFAKTGDPNIEENGSLTSTEWPKYGLNAHNYLLLDRGAQMTSGTYVRGKQVTFWKRILPSLNVSCPLYMS